MGSFYSKGQKYGEWTITGEPFRHPLYRRVWKGEVTCSCGNSAVINLPSLRYGQSTRCFDCGCKTAGKARTKHGHVSRTYKTGSYKSWRDMKARCLNPNHRHYAYYGGAGISIDPAWISYEGFYADMGDRPEGYTLDRIQGTLGYYKDNCRWATRKEQRRNQERNIMLTHLGKTRCLADWAEVMEIKRTTLYAALYRGETFEEFLNKRNIVLQ